MPEKNCPHRDIRCEIANIAFEDSNVRMIELRATCDACGRRFIFLGAPIGTSLQRPTISADGGKIALPTVAEDEAPDLQIESVVSAVRPIGPMQ